MFLPFAVPLHPAAAQVSLPGRCESPRPHLCPQIVIHRQSRRFLVLPLSEQKLLGSGSKNQEIVFKVQTQFC